MEHLKTNFGKRNASVYRLEDGGRGGGGISVYRPGIVGGGRAEDFDHVSIKFAWSHIQAL